MTAEKEHEEQKGSGEELPELDPAVRRLFAQARGGPLPPEGSAGRVRERTLAAARRSRRRALGVSAAALAAVAAVVLLVLARGRQSADTRALDAVPWLPGGPLLRGFVGQGVTPLRCPRADLLERRLRRVQPEARVAETLDATLTFSFVHQGASATVVVHDGGAVASCRPRVELTHTAGSPEALGPLREALRAALSAPGDRPP